MSALSSGLKYVVMDTVTNRVMTEPCDSEEAAEAELVACFPRYTAAEIMRMGFEIVQVVVTVDRAERERPSRALYLQPCLPL